MMQNPHLSHDSNKALDKSPLLSLWTPCACMSLTCVSAVVCLASVLSPGLTVDTSCLIDSLLTNKIFYIKKLETNTSDSFQVHKDCVSHLW